MNDDAANWWADALADMMGPVGEPSWLLVTKERAWRVPGCLGARRASAVAFAQAFRKWVPGAQIVEAGTPRATELILACERADPDEVDRSLRWN